MKRNSFKIITAALLALILTITLVMLSSADETRGTLSISCDKKTITPGSEITLNFTFSENLSGGIYRLVYDKNVLTWVSTDADPTVKSMSVEETADHDVVMYEIKKPSEITTKMPTVTFKVSDKLKEGDNISVGVASTATFTDADVKSIKANKVDSFTYSLPSSNVDVQRVEVKLYETSNNRAADLYGISKTATLSGGAYVFEGLPSSHLYYRLTVVTVSSGATVSYDAREGTLSAGSTKSTSFTVKAENGATLKYTVRLMTISCVHSWQVTSSGKVDPTCTAAGTTMRTNYKCSFCSETKSEDRDVIPALGHSFETSTVAPGCETEGYKLVKCSRCGSESREDTVAPLGHNYVVKSSTTTCKELGETVWECPRCKDSYTEADTEYKNHDYEEKHTASTCETLGETVYTCKLCGDSYSEKETALAEHSPKENVTPAKCLESGWITTVCSVCGKTLSSAIGEKAKGHQYGDWIEVIKATAEKEGLLKRTCSECNAAETMRVDPLTSVRGETGSGVPFIVVLILIILIIILGILLIITYLTYRKKRQAEQ